MNTIPKVFNLCWKYKDGLENSQSPIILNGLRNIIDLNPDWKVVIHDDEDIEEYLKNSLSKDDYELIKDIHIVEKTDVWRLLKMYLEGGAYIDLDRFYNIRMKEVISDYDEIRCVLPICLDRDFSHDIMISCSKNPIHDATLNLMFQRRREGHTNTYFLGPQTYMHAITMTLCGRMINTNAGPEEMEFIKNELKEYPFIKTYVENPPYDTIVYKHSELLFNYGNSSKKTWEEMKREFYGSFSIKHWTDEW